MYSQPSPGVRDCLLTIITGWRDTIQALTNAGKLTLLPASERFSYFVTIDGMDESELKQNTQASALKDQIPELPFAQRSLKECLDRTLTLDTQIRAMCALPWGLAKAMDLLLFDAGSNQTHEAALSHLLERFFEEPFQRMALIHLYNLRTDEPEIKLPSINCRILTLTESDVPFLTGETTLTSKLHYSHTGNCFLVFETNEIEESDSWLGDQWQKASDFVDFLRYLQSTIVDVDYACRFYKPTWVNNIRKYGIDLMGRPRWFQQTEVYHLSNELLPKLQAFLQTVETLQPILSDLSSDLRRSLRLAGLRYETHHTKDSLVEQLVDLSIALEALFSPSDRTELSFRISQGVALVLGNTTTQRRELYDLVRRMYKERSAFVHGGKDPIETGSVTAEDIRRLSDVVRRAILAFGTLFVRGERSRERLHKQIEIASFDSSKADELRKQCDIETFMAEKSNFSAS